MEESTLRWPTDKEREEMEEVCTCRTPKAVSDFDRDSTELVGEGDNHQ